MNKNQFGFGIAFALARRLGKGLLSFGGRMHDEFIQCHIFKEGAV